MSPLFIDVDLINAYLPDATQLSLEKAMAIAIERDEEAAFNLEVDCIEALDFESSPSDETIKTKKKEAQEIINELFGLS